MRKVRSGLTVSIVCAGLLWAGVAVEAEEFSPEALVKGDLLLCPGCRFCYQARRTQLKRRLIASCGEIGL